MFNRQTPVLTSLPRFIHSFITQPAIQPAGHCLLAGSWTVSMSPCCYWWHQCIVVCDAGSLECSPHLVILSVIHHTVTPFLSRCVYPYNLRRWDVLQSSVICCSCNNTLYSLCVCYVHRWRNQSWISFALLAVAGKLAQSMQKCRVVLRSFCY